MQQQGGFNVRPGGRSDVAAVLAMFDGAVRWLVARGRVGQWGDKEKSTDPRLMEMVDRWAHDGELYLACLDETPVGALAVGAAPPHVPAAVEPELYVNLLLTDRSYAGHRIGGRLLAYAADMARDRGLGLVRIDCYAGDDGALVRYYERQGFLATETFTVQLPTGPWPGQVLEQRLAAPA